VAVMHVWRGLPDALRVGVLWLGAPGGISGHVTWDATRVSVSKAVVVNLTFVS